MLGMFANRRSGLQNAMDGNPLAGAMSFNPAGQMGPTTSGPQQMPGMTAPLQQQMPEPQGMMGSRGRGGVDWGQLGAMILAANGNPLGQFGLQQRALTQRQEHEARQAQAQAAQQRAEWLWRQEWERANPRPQQPTEIMRLAEEAGYQPGTPQWQEAMRTAFLNRQNPMVGIDVQQPDGSTIRQFIRPPQGGGQQGGRSAPPQAIEHLRANPNSAAQFDEMYGPGSAARILQGGPSQPATGNFR